MPTPGKTAIWMISGLAAVIRLHSLFSNSFHADEALFASWARLIAVWRDPLLQTQLVDKPPVSFYLQAVFYPILGPVEWAARLPGLIASILLVPLVGVFVWKVYDDELVAVLSALFVALSPMAIQFSGTAFTDPLMTTLLFVSYVMIGQPGKKTIANHKKIMLSGLFFGLAIATKHQAWLFVPLLAGLTLSNGWKLGNWGRWLFGVLIVVLLLFSWEFARTGSLTLWKNQIINYGGVRLLWSWEIWPRLASWLELWQWVVAQPFLLFIIPLSYILPNRNKGNYHQFDHLLILYIFAYFIAHWLIAVPIWDRYLLPIVPLISILLGHRIAEFILWFSQKWPVFSPHKYRIQSMAYQCRRKVGANKNSVFFKSPLMLSMTLLFLIQLPQTAASWEGNYPIGGQQYADQGAAEIASLLADAPYGTVLFDHWYSWHWQYQLFDKRVYVSWFDNPAVLYDELVVFGNDGNLHYLVVPNSETARPILRTVQTAGFQLRYLPENDSNEKIRQIALYQILPQGASW